MDEQFIDAFIAPLTNVLATMAMMETSAGAPQKKIGHVAQGDITGLIELTGEKARGSLALSFDTPVVTEVMQRLFGEVPDAGDDSIKDMVGEITNMVTGGAKNLLGDLGFEFNMSVPKVMSGVGHEIRHMVDEEVMVVPLQTEHGRISLELCFALFA